MEIDIQLNAEDTSAVDTCKLVIWNLNPAELKAGQSLWFHLEAIDIQVPVVWLRSALSNEANMMPRAAWEVFPHSR